MGSLGLEPVHGPNPGQAPWRVLVVTTDAGLVDSLRRDARLCVVAHVEDPALAGPLAAGAHLDAILTGDEETAAVVSGLVGGLAGERRGPAGAGSAGGATAGLPVYVVRPTLGWVPAPGAGTKGFPGAASAAGPEARTSGAAPGVTPHLCGSSQPTLRDWWLRSQSPGSGLPAPYAGGPARARPAGLPAPVPEVLMRQTIVVVSPKGGVGKTFVSVNLAASLARHTGFRVLLLDLDLHSGDAAVHLDLIGQRTLADLLPYAAELEAGHLARAVVMHGPSRLEVLLAPAKPESAEMVAREHLGCLLRLVKQGYDFVVVDTPPDPADPLVETCLEEATAVVLVCSLDAAALRQCRLLLESLCPGGREPARRLALVLNQAHEGGPLPPGRAASFLEEAAPGARTFTIPEDRAAVERAVFDGRPLTLTEPGHAVSRAVFELAHAFCPVFGGLLGDGRGKRTGFGRLIDVIRKW